MARALFENKPIDKENFIFHDKHGKFFMYSSVIERFTKGVKDGNCRLEVWSEDGPDGQPFALKIKMTILDDLYATAPKYSPKGSVAYMKIPYLDIRVNELPYVVNDLVCTSQGLRLMDKIPGATIYMVMLLSRRCKCITAEEFDSQDKALFDSDYWAARKASESAK